MDWQCLLILSHVHPMTSLSPRISRQPFAYFFSPHLRHCAKFQYSSNRESYRFQPPPRRVTVSSGGGLKGVVLGDSYISVVGDSDRGLQYRGYSAATLAIEASFEEVAHLLIHGNLPSKAELRAFQNRIVEHSILPEAVKNVTEQLPPSMHPMDVLRTGCSVLGGLEATGLSSGVGEGDIASKAAAERLLGTMPAILEHWYRHHHFDGRIVGRTMPSMAQRVVDIFGIKERDAEFLIQRILVLYAEHDLNASAFAARVAASTKADIFSCVCAALSTLRGPLHGGALYDAIQLIQRFDSPEAAEGWVRTTLEQKHLVSGFGHRVYRFGDPRSTMIKAWAREMARGNKTRETVMAVAERIEETMLLEKGLRSNVDFYASVVFFFLGIPADMMITVFAMARTAGWTAHVLEQQANNKLIRPVSLYKGPIDLAFVPLDDRATAQQAWDAEQGGVSSWPFVETLRHIWRR